MKKTTKKGAISKAVGQKTKTKTKVIKAVSKVDYDKLTPKEQRLLVAKDVLKQLRLGKYIAECGTYVSHRDMTLSEKEFYRPSGQFAYDRYEAACAAVYEQDAQEFFKTRGDCHVCAIGAAVVSKARLFDRATLKDMGGTGKFLAELFADQPDVYRFKDECQMRWQMEGAFENGSNGPDVKIAKLKSPKARLKAIFENIVRNKGDFIPVTE